MFDPIAPEGSESESQAAPIGRKEGLEAFKSTIICFLHMRAVLA